MSWHGVLTGSSIGAHAGMAAKVLRALAAVLVGGAAKAGNLKERIVGHTEKLLTLSSRAPDASAITHNRRNRPSLVRAL